jgi:hypothetical protein
MVNIVTGILPFAGALAILVPSPAAALTKAFSGKPCKVAGSPKSIECPPVSWSINSALYTVTAVNVTAEWEARVAYIDASVEVNDPTTEYVFGPLSDSKTNTSFLGVVFAQNHYQYLSFSPAASNSGSVSYSVTTTSDKARTAGIFFNSMLSYIKNVKVSVDYTVNPTSDVPEPSTWLMLITGFGLTGAALRRRRVTQALSV